MKTKFTAVLTATLLLAAPAVSASATNLPPRLLSSAVHSGNVQLEPGTYTFKNFSQANGTAGYRIPISVKSISGAGMNASVLQMIEHSSTRASKVPKKPYTTNQLSLLVSQGTNLSNLTLQGTAQGHLYNGLRVQRASGTEVANVKVVAIPGSKNYPPGETFGINDYRTSGSSYRSIEVDGGGTGAAGFGGNNSQGISVSDAYFHDNPHSHGITFWQSKNITLTDVKSFKNYGAFNFERDSGVIKIVRPQWGKIRSGHTFSFNSDKASAKVSIIDPVLPEGEAKVKIFLAKKYLGVKNKQRKSDIHIYQQGKDVTAQLAQFIS